MRPSFLPRDGRRKEKRRGMTRDAISFNGLPLAVIAGPRKLSTTTSLDHSPPTGRAIDNANGCALGNRLNECLQESRARENRFNTALGIAASRRPVERDETLPSRPLTRLTRFSLVPKVAARRSRDRAPSRTNPTFYASLSYFLFIYLSRLFSSFLTNSRLPRYNKGQLRRKDFNGESTFCSGLFAAIHTTRRL